jgi:hypothetical protein
METSVLFIRRGIKQTDRISEGTMYTVAEKITISRLMPYMTEGGL